MEAEKVALAAALDNLSNETAVATRHAVDLAEQLKREEMEFERKLANSKSAIATADSQIRELRSNYAANERQLLAGRKQQLDALTKQVRETIAAEQHNKFQSLLKERAELLEVTKSLEQQRDAAMEAKIAVTRPVSPGRYVAENAENSNPHIDKFMYRLFKMQDGWRQADISKISSYVREEVRAALTDVCQHRQSVFSGQKLQRSRALSEHYSLRDTEFNAFRLKRATVNEEHRAQTVDNVRKKAKDSVRSIAEHMKMHVAGLEQLMANETTQQHQQIRQTIESMVEKRRAHVAQEDAEAERKIADARSRAVEERKQLVERLQAEMIGLRNRVAALEAGAALSIGSDLSHAFAATDGATGGAEQSATSVSSSAWLRQRARITEDASRIRSDAEAALGQFRGQTKSNARINDGTSGVNGRYDNVNDMRRSLDQAKSTSREAWQRLAGKIEEISGRIVSIESTLRADVVAQSAEAEAVRQEWEKELRQHMHKTHERFGSRSAEAAVAEFALGLRNRVGGARQMMSHLRAQRNDVFAEAMGESEAINSAFEQVLMATTQLLDKCPELAAASTKAKLLTEFVEKDAALLEEDRAIVGQEKSSRARVKELAKKNLVAASRGGTSAVAAAGVDAAANATCKSKRAVQNDEGTATTTTTTTMFEETDSYAQQHKRPNRHHHRDPAMTSAAVASSAGYSLSSAAAAVANNAPPSRSAIPSARALQDPFVQRIVAASAAAAGSSRGRQPTRLAPDDSFEKLVDFSDVMSSSGDHNNGNNNTANASNSNTGGVRQYRAMYTTAAAASNFQQQPLRGVASSSQLTTPTPDSVSGA